MRILPAALVRRLLLIAMVGAAPLGAQSPTQRRSLDALRDSLREVSDTAALRQREIELIGRAKQTPDDAMLHLRLGLVALRLGDLGQRESYDDAGSEFQWAIDLRPRWPWGWYGLGMAELGVGDSDVALVSGLQTMLGKDALTRSANAFARSAEVDPSFVEGLVELTGTALQQRVNTRTEVALAALRRAAGTQAASHPAVLLARGRIEREVGSPDSSAAALTRLLRTDSSDVLIRYELARTGFLTGDPSAPDRWYQALGSADAALRERFRADLGYVMADSILAVFDTADAAGREALVRDFWARRDRADLRPDGARLAEHYRRLEYARAAFRLSSATRQYDIAERYRSGQDLVDDRGIIHIRHGPPDDRATYTAPDIDPNETWWYRREGGGWLVHFVARDDVQDYRLVESVFDVLGFATTVAMRESDAPLGEFTHLDGLLRTREGFDPTYRRLQGAGRGSAAGLLTDERAEGRAGLITGTTSDSWPLRFAEPLDAAITTVAVGADSAGARLQVAFAVPRAAIDTLMAEDSLPGAAVRVRAAVLSLAGVPVASLDTMVRVIPADADATGGHLLGRVPLRVPVGRFTVRAAVDAGAIGHVMPRDSVTVVAPNAASPALSDLALGTARLPLAWVPAASPDSAWLNPLQRYQRTDLLRVYVEVSGVRPTAPYQLEVTVRRPGSRSFLRRLFGGGGAAIRVTFEAEHPGGVAGIHREFGLSRLEPGAYQLEVRLRAEGGGPEVTRTANILVEP